MREILFRGKTNKGEWVEGSLHIEYGEATKDGKRNTDYRILGMRGECKYIIPETIGQFTGLTDKNGKKIFEGDILSERPPMNQTAYIGYVAYDEKSAVWRFMIKNDTKYNGVLLGSYSNSYKVIGNIHDNPEFLKGGVEE